jgi:Adenylate and Guanylate cyclase catalytic domain
MSETRKIAAILVSDVVGYSRLAGADEDRTLARLRALRSDLIDPTISVHHGRIVKRTGDGSVIEFRSVVDAVRCVLEVQHAMVERNAGVAPDKRIEFRIGIHLGDVVEESDGEPPPRPEVSAPSKPRAAPIQVSVTTPPRLIDMTDTQYNGLTHYDSSLYTSLAGMLNEEPVQPRDLQMMGMLLPLGIEKGAPFNPDAETVAQLNSASVAAHAWLVAQSITAVTPLVAQKPMGDTRRASVRGPRDRPKLALLD